mgnify:CR=1 FL=1
MKAMQSHILIIEDETDIREALAEAFEAAHFTVSTADNGEDGLAKAINTHPDIILLDIMMPKMDGHEVLRRLRQDAWGLRAKVIILTSMDDVQNIVTDYEGQIADYAIKVHHSLRDVIKKVQTALHIDD